MFQVTSATNKLLKLHKRIRGVAGGTSAGKTISILTILIDYAQSTEGELISVVSESFPHLRRGAMRDFLSIMQSQHYFDDNRWSKTDYTYTFETGSKIEFFSADQPGKVRGPRRDVLFVNEANNIPYEAFDQLRVRTKKIIWIDYNPTSEFWWYTEVAPYNDVDFVTLTYKDNEALDPLIVKDIEDHRHNKAWWRVYGEGLLGEVEGKVYRDWQIIDEIPHEARLERRGLDFGFSNDPAVLVDVYVYNGGYIVQSQFYRKGMHNKDIADFINNLPQPQMLVIADSAEPKSINELRMYGINIIGAEKGAGSVTRGIDWVQSQKVSLIKSDTSLIKAYRNYMWMTDKEGKVLNKPDHYWSDGMDAVRYAMETFRPREEEDEHVTSGNITTFWGQ